MRLASGDAYSPVLSLLYHDVCDDPSETGFQRPAALPYKHRIGEFLQHLEIVAEVAPRPLTIPEYLEYPSTEYSVMLTFDDGGKSAMRIADILDEKSWRGHFFVTTSMIGQRAFLCSPDIRELNARGHWIGSHSHSHRTPFNSLSPMQMRGEWNESLLILSDILGKEIVSASVPGGDISRSVLRSAADSGIKWLFTSEPRIRPWACGPLLCFGRICPKAGVPLDRVRRLATCKGLGRERGLRLIKTAGKRLLRPVYIRWSASAHRERE